MFNISSLIRHPGYYWDAFTCLALFRLRRHCCGRIRNLALTKNLTDELSIPDEYQDAYSVKHYSVSPAAGESAI